MWDRIDGKEVDDAALEGEIVNAIAEVVKRQDAIGIDLISDGEMGRIGFCNYFFERFTGFAEFGSVEMIPGDFEEFPEVAEEVFANESGAHIQFAKCVGPVGVAQPDGIHEEIERFRAALGDRPPATAFMNQVTPGQISFEQPDTHYGSHAAYLEALGAALRHEYKAITDAGFVLQLDSPDLAMAHHFTVVDSSLPAYEQHVAMAIEALNAALEGIPPEQVRLHICWGNYAGPHHRDVELKDVLSELLKAHVGVLSFEAANPRHAHEWQVFEDVELPDGMAIMPGVIDVTTNRIEHPELIAQRIERFAGIVGRERVIAAPDCGFGTFVGWHNVHPDLAWAKLGALVEGARLASEHLWK
jgi:5-methyltetrahydropteroyltriglutamate--homocysteine methyltransferase